MKRYRGWIVPFVSVMFCVSIVWLTLRLTAEYPVLGEPVSYAVNEIEGMELTIDEPSWSPFKGYTLQYEATADSDEVYYFVQDGEDPDFEFLERYVDGQWYRLAYSQDNSPFNPIEFALGGETSVGLSGSLVQKYAYYGTRLESGTYRLVLEMRAEDETLHYLAAEFEVK